MRYWKYLLPADRPESEKMPMNVKCYECERRFDLTDENEAEEWFYGHDCEAE